MNAHEDAIDQVRTQWREIFPDVDTSPMAITGRIRLLAQLIQQGSDAVLLRLGLSRADFDILSVLMRAAKPMTPTQITQQSLITAPGMTKRLRRMEDQELIRRIENPSDGRGFLIEPLPEARERVHRAVHAISNFENELLVHLETTHVIQLHESLKRFLAVVEENL